jgi:hypothetical protein
MESPLPPEEGANLWFISPLPPEGVQIYVITEIRFINEEVIEVLSLSKPESKSN